MVTENTVSHPPPRPQPSAWMVRWMAFLGPQARVLDLACGHGRNTAAALARGARVLAVDRDRDALARLPEGAQPLCADLEGAPWPSELAPASQFDAIVVANYLFRPRLDLLPACLAPGGLMLYETFAAGNARYGRPANPAFLLEPGELFAWAAIATGCWCWPTSTASWRAARVPIVQRLAAVRSPAPFELTRYPLEPVGVRAPIGRAGLRRLELRLCRTGIRTEVTDHDQRKHCRDRDPDARRRQPRPAALPSTHRLACRRRYGRHRGGGHDR
jgi:SAM-dependent methyltransferase